MRATTITCIMAVAVVLAGARVESVAADSAREISSGTWRSERADAKGSWSANLKREGESLSGTFSLTNSPIRDGEVTGMVADGGSVTVGVLDRNAVGPGASRDVITFTGTLDGASVRGTYRTAFGDSGTWEGTFALP